jgi:hypothetical protein
MFRRQAHPAIRLRRTGFFFNRIRYRETGLQLTPVELPFQHLFGVKTQHFQRHDVAGRMAAQNLTVGRHRPVGGQIHALHGEDDVARFKPTSSAGEPESMDATQMPDRSSPMVTASLLMPSESTLPPLRNVSIRGSASSREMANN